MKTTILIALAVLLGLQATPSTAAPVALILEVEGDSKPAIEPFSEVESNSSLDLDEGAKLVFQHYSTCDTVTVVGGRVSFTERQFLVRRGKIVDVQRERCPKTTSLGKDTKVGGVLMRGRKGGGMRLRPRPRFVFTGARRAEFKSLRILKDDTALLEAPIESPRFDWPKDKAPLAPGEGYALEVVPAGGGKALRLDFQVKGRGKSPLTVVRLN